MVAILERKIARIALSQFSNARGAIYTRTMSIKIIPIALGVIALALLAVLIFVPAKKSAAPSGDIAATSASSSNVSTADDRNGSADAAVYYDYSTVKGKNVKASVQSGQIISRPITFTGNVPAGWAFEASFPVRIVDANGNVLGQNPARVPNWMSGTTAWYTVTVMYAKPSTSSGFIVLVRDDPSGLEQNADEVKIPVRF